MNTNHPQFLAIKRFVNAVETFHERAVDWAEHPSERADVVGMLREYAPPVVTGLRDVSTFIAFFATPEESADLAMCSMREDFARRAERENDLMLAADERDACARFMVHVARRIVEARMGAIETPLERQLKASVAMNDQKAKCLCDDPGVAMGRGTCPVHEAKRTYPHDHDLKARAPVVAISTSQVIPLNGKAGA